MKQEVSHAVVSSTPPAAISAAIIAGLTLDDWVKIATLVYLGIQGLYLLYKFWRER